MVSLFCHQIGKNLQLNEQHKYHQPWHRDDGEHEKKVFFDMVFDDGADIASRFDLVGRNISIIALIE